MKEYFLVNRMLKINTDYLQVELVLKNNIIYWLEIGKINSRLKLKIISKIWWIISDKIIFELDFLDKNVTYYE